MTPEELMKNEALTAKIQAAKDFDDVLRILREAGVEVDEEALRAELAADGEELSEASLENVAGGVKISTVVKIVAEWIKHSPIYPVPFTPIRPGTTILKNKKRK